MAEPTQNHRAGLRAAKGNYTKVGRDLAALERLDCETLDTHRVEHLTDSLTRAKEAFEHHLLALHPDDQNDDEQYDSERAAQNELYESHRMGIQALLAKNAALILLAELDLALNELESNAAIGYTPALNHDLDHASSLAHRVRQARSKPSVRNCPELTALGERAASRLFVLKQCREDYATDHLPAPTVIAPTVTSSSGSTLKLNLPTFDGQIDKWREFWKLFSSLLAQHPELTDEAKQAHLVKQMGTAEAREQAENAFEFGESYDEAVKMLRTHYEKPRQLLKHHVEQVLATGKFSNCKSDITALTKCMKKCVAGLKKIGTYDISQFLASFYARCMEPDLLAHWGKDTETQVKPPKAEEMIAFLERHLGSVPDDDLASGCRNTPRSKTKPKTEKTVLRLNPRSQHQSDRSTSTSSKSAKCYCCDNFHSLYSCPQFKRQSCQERWDLVKSKDLCFNCLNPSHRSADCGSKHRCRECDRPHHTLLHETRPARASKNGALEASVKVMNGKSTVTTHCSVPRTAIAEVCSSRITLRGRIQMDSGAEVSLITKKFAAQAKARRIPHSSTEICGVEGSFTSPYRVALTLRGLDGELVETEFHLVDHLAISFSGADMQEVYALPFLRDLNMADPTYTNASRIDMLMDMGTSLVCSKDKFLRSNNMYLRAEETIFGWTVGGRHDTASAAAVRAPQVLKVISSEEKLEELVERHWEMEQFPFEKALVSTQDAQALEQFKDTVCRDSDGRYSVSLPKKMPAVALGESRGMALRRTESTEKGHKRRGDWERYQSNASEYSELRHAERVPYCDMSKPCDQHFYLPIHSVVKPTSTSTKFRLVFDASAKSSNGFSLNDSLLPGPSLYPPISSILMQFREWQIGMTSDIAKMFRGIGLNQDDRDFHRFFLRGERGELEEWRMTRVTFGVTSSPFLATQVLHEIAEEYGEEFPEAAKAIKQSFYVDDCLVGANDVDSAKQLREDINSILEKACLTIRKWRTSSTELTKSIPQDLRELEDTTKCMTPNLCPKTLGIHWSEDKDDMFVATPSATNFDNPTKRDLLSVLAKVYDVLGWFSPSLLQAKALMQETWKLELGWTEPLPDPIRQQMEEWCLQLPLISKHPIPRCYHKKNLVVDSVSLHGFADASLKGYGGVVYVRSLYTDMSVSVCVATSRSRVVPIKKPPTIPRLELCAALMTAELLSYVANVLQVPSLSLYCWSDSTAVLGWINHHPSRLNTYVGNRVAKLTDCTSPTSWRYVNTSSNPADCLSRGMSPQALVQHPLWWQGPPWLSQDPSEWPRRPDINLSRELPEMKATVRRLSPVEPEMGIRISSFTKLVRVVSWVWRYVNKLKKRSDVVYASNTYLSLHELRRARTTVLRHSQRLHYSQECQLLEAQQYVPDHLSIASLSPYLDEEGLLRVGGRLQKAGLPPDVTHPLILSVKSHSVFLLLSQLHLDSLHAGPQAMMAILSQHYHVPRVKQLLRKLSHSCVICREARAKRSQQMMGELPEVRVTPARPFANVGLDFAGPFSIKSGPPRRPRYVKAYICVYVCLSTKAVHLEVVSNLTTQAFMASLSRFVGRRGLPNDVYSDNGTNFKGAVAELEEVRALLRAQDAQETITLWAAPRQVNWHFNPASSPHFGGLWEAAVGSMKTSLKKILGNVSLNFEELATVTIQAEAMLNSRPLVPADTLSDEAVPLLTAGHFLIGAPLLSLPTTVDADSKLCLLKRWNLTRRLTLDLWTRWSNEYLSQLQRRTKWRRRRRNVRVNDVVLITGESTFNRRWPKGRVCQVYPGKDGLVRTVDVQTDKGIFRRPVAKLCVLIEAIEDEATTGEYVQAEAFPQTETVTTVANALCV